MLSWGKNNMNESRIIYFNGGVDEISSLQAIIQLLAYNSENHDPIYMYINSPGGSIIHGLAIYDTIKNIESPVYTICTGLAASMGSFLLSIGEKGHRGALKHSRILIHQPLILANSGYAKRESDLRKSAESLNENRKELENILAERTGQPLEKLHKDCERDNWMTAEEALAYGLIDKIV